MSVYDNTINVSYRLCRFIGKQKGAERPFFIAEAMGFEPMEVLQTSSIYEIYALDRSATPPNHQKYWQGYLFVLLVFLNPPVLTYWVL